jgi:hypothetical protein
MANDKRDPAKLPYYLKVAGAKDLDKIMSPWNGPDVKRLRDDLVKLKTEMLNTQDPDKLFKETINTWFKNEYKSLCLQEKIDCLNDDYVTLFHSMIDKVIEGKMPGDSVKMYQSIMKYQMENNRLMVELYRIQAAATLKADENNIKRDLSRGFIDADEDDKKE